MTTIAYKDGILAADSLTCVGDIAWNKNARKIIDLEKGNFLACTGYITTSHKVADYIKKNGIANLGNLNTYYKDNMFLLWYNKNIYTIDAEMFPHKLDRSKFYSLGSGREIAMGAMQVGKSAKEAIKAAIELDTFSGGKVNFRECIK